MTLPVIVRPAAQADIQRINDDLEQLRVGLGRQFMTRLREVLERIENFPELYGVIWQDVRAARLKQFRHIALLCRVRRSDRSHRRDSRIARCLGVAIAGIN